MKPVRTLMAGLIGAALATPAFAAAPCLQPAEQTAFQVQALKSQLMVAALACGHQDEYNAFIRRFQNDLTGAGRTVTAHFRRAYGGAHQREMDLYITNLANAQSQDGIRQGNLYCGNVAPLFQQVMAAPNASDLAKISVEKQVVQAYSASACTVAGRGVTRVAARNERAKPVLPRHHTPARTAHR